MVKATVPTPGLFLIIGAIALSLAVLLGAFGAHALRDLLTEEMRSVYRTASQYHFYHALGLLLVGELGLRWPACAYLRRAGWLLVIGMVLFSGSLYLLSISGLRWLGAITPLGGVAFVVAWVMVGVGVWAQTRGGRGDGG